MVRRGVEVGKLGALAIDTKQKPYVDKHHAEEMLHASLHHSQHATHVHTVTSICYGIPRVGVIQMKGMVKTHVDLIVNGPHSTTFCCSCVFIFVHAGRQQPAIRTKHSPDQAAWFHRQHVRSRDEHEVCRHDGMHAFEA